MYWTSFLSVSPSRASADLLEVNCDDESLSQHKIFNLLDEHQKDTLMIVTGPCPKLESSKGFSVYQEHAREFNIRFGNKIGIKCGQNEPDLKSKKYLHGPG